MHVIDGTRLGAVKGKPKMAEGVQTLVRLWQPLLDNRFALIHTLTMPGRREQVDALLMGPHGALVLKVDASAGRYRCLGDNWYVWDKKLNDLVPAEENPIRPLKQGQRMVEAALTAQGMGTTVPVDGAVVFVNPKLQLEHMEPAVRLIDFNGLKDFAAQLAATPIYVEKHGIEKALAVFGAQVTIAPTTRLAVQAPSSAPKTPARVSRGPFGLKRWQFIVLVAMVVAYVLLAILAVYLIASTMG